MRGSITAQRSIVETSSSATNLGKQLRRVKYRCMCTGGKLWAENVFTNGSNAFAKRKKRLSMGYVRVGYRQAEPQKLSRKCDKCDRRLTLRLIEEELGISKDTAHTIFRDDLCKRKICSRFVPHKLTDEQDPLVLENIVTGDENWCYQFDP